MPCGRPRLDQGTGELAQGGLTLRLGNSRGGHAVSNAQLLDDWGTGDFRLGAETCKPRARISQLLPSHLMGNRRSQPGQV